MKVLTSRIRCDRRSGAYVIRVYSWGQGRKPTSMGTAGKLLLSRTRVKVQPPIINSYEICLCGYFPMCLIKREKERKWRKGIDKGPDWKFTTKSYLLCPDGALTRLSVPQLRGLFNVWGLQASGNTLAPLCFFSFFFVVTERLYVCQWFPPGPKRPDDNWFRISAHLSASLTHIFSVSRTLLFCRPPPRFPMSFATDKIIIELIRYNPVFPFWFPFVIYVQRTS